MSHTPGWYFAILAVALCTLAGRKCPAASPPPTTQQSGGATTRPTSENDLDRRRRQLLALWDHAQQSKESDADRPLYRAQSGYAVPYRSLPDGSPLGATLVSVEHAHTARNALVQVARQADIRITASSPGMFQVDPPGGFSMDIQRKPLLEALDEICSRAGWTIEQIVPASSAAATQPAGPGAVGTIVLGPQQANHGLGVWSTTGPFLFEVRRLEHSSDIGAISTTDRLQVVVRIWTEPKLRAFSVAAGLSVREAVDDLGNFLQPLPTAPDTELPRTQAWLGVGLPAPFGRRIARLSARDQCFIQRAASRIETSVDQNISRQAIEGLHVSIASKVDGDSMPTVTLSVDRGERSELDWNDLRLAMVDVQPQIYDGADALMRVMFSTVKQNDKQVVIEYSWLNRDDRGRLRAAAKVAFEIPTDVKWIDAPVEFHDLPLP